MVCLRLIGGLVFISRWIEPLGKECEVAWLLVQKGYKNWKN